MHHRHTNTLAALIISALINSTNSAAAPVPTDPPPSAETHRDGEWISLFNGKNLSGWHLVLTDDHKGIDPETVFQVHDGVLHAYRDVPQGAPVPIGYLATDDKFSSYRLKLEYRWIGKRFAPRIARPRDAGILYHAGSEQRVWPCCIECQIQEKDVGDCYTVRGVQVESTFDPARLKAGERKYLSAKDGGVVGEWGGPGIQRIVKGSMHENDDWNTVEVIVRGDEEAIHIVNGHEVFRAAKLKKLDTDEKSWIPLTSGHVLLQCEYAEIQYRNVKIKPLEGRPFRVTEPAKTTDAKRSE